MENQIANKTVVPKITAKNIAEERARTRRYLVSGLLWAFAGFVLLIITYIRSSGTRGHVVVWAAFLLGGVQFVRGMGRLKILKQNMKIVLLDSKPKKK